MVALWLLGPHKTFSSLGVEERSLSLSFLFHLHTHPCSLSLSFANWLITWNHSISLSLSVSRTNTHKAIDSHVWTLLFLSLSFTCSFSLSFFLLLVSLSLCLSSFLAVEQTLSAPIGLVLFSLAFLLSQFRICKKKLVQKVFWGQKQKHVF